jgi:hypothetical protein
MKRILLAVTFVLTTSGITDNATATLDDRQGQATISVWYDLNALCRGSSDDYTVKTACCTRTKVDGLLNQMGYCYRTGERWVKCTAHDKRAVPTTKRCYE